MVWARCDGHENLELDVDESFDHFYLLIQGARCGLGVANVLRLLVQDDLESGPWLLQWALSVAPTGSRPGLHLTSAGDPIW